MNKYMIHACPQRMWYVNEYLIPTMKIQGIPADHILVFEDVDRLGNLKACLESFSQIPNDSAATWHLQDDVVISKSFKHRTDSFENGIICGFASRISREKPPGIVNSDKMWYSFPCIRIPNRFVHEFLHWFNRKMVKNPDYWEMIAENKYDDEFFKLFLLQNYPDLNILNLAPNLVNHVDNLLGGSATGDVKPLRPSIYWDEEDTMSDLMDFLNKRG